MLQALYDIAVQHLTCDGTNYPLAAGTSDVNSGSVDMANFGGVAFLVAFGDNADTGTFAGKLQQSDDDGSADDWSDVAGSAISFTAGATDTDNKMIAWDVRAPLKRYLRVAIDRGTANTVIQSLIALKYTPRETPVTQATGAGQFIADKVKFLVSPAEGTA